MKKILFWFMSAVLFAACASEEPVDTAYGYLAFDDVTLTCNGEVVPPAKAVDAGLQVQICKDGQVLPGHDYAPGSDFSKRFALPVGTYTVKAFTPDRQEAPNNALGHPVYSVESDPFQVVEGDLTTVSLVAPQINTGVRVTFAPSALSDFPDISVILTSLSGRKLTIGAAQDGAYGYFNVPTDGRLTYEIKMSNADGESFSIPEKAIEVKAGNYEIAVCLD